jgi:SAM-dependent methyltransferase
MEAGYNYARTTAIGRETSADEALYASMMNYCHEQLGWSVRRTEARVRSEIERRYPKGVLDKLERRQWALPGKRVLDVGAGQGGCLIELLARGADAVGVEPFDEFAEVARLRLDAAGFDRQRLVQSRGEELPFPDDSFDYAISLQVLEHVADPGAILTELYRVLKPGARVFIACENYLSFREQHYKMRWFPLLPKALGVRYLRLRGRPPAFFRDHVHYSTYLQIVRRCREIGFVDLTYRSERRRWERRQAERHARNARARRLPVMRPLARGRDRLANLAFGPRYHASRAFRAGIRLHLEKPGPRLPREGARHRTIDQAATASGDPSRSDRAEQNRGGTETGWGDREPGRDDPGPRGRMVLAEVLSTSSGRRERP